MVGQSCISPFLPSLGFDNLCFFSHPLQILEPGGSLVSGARLSGLRKKVLLLAAACPANTERQPGPLPPRAASSLLISCLAVSSTASPAPGGVPGDTCVMTVQLVASHRCWRGLSKHFSWCKTRARIQITSQAPCCPCRAGLAWLEVTEAASLALTSAGITEHIQEIALGISHLVFHVSIFQRSGVVQSLMYLCLSVLLNILVGLLSPPQHSNSHPQPPIPVRLCYCWQKEGQYHYFWWVSNFKQEGVWPDAWRL